MSGAVGTRFLRADGEGKVRGDAVYGPDFAEARTLHARILRSPVAHGRIVRLDVERARTLPGVRAVLTGEDCPNRSGWIIKDQTLMARGTVRYVGEPVAVVAAETLAQAEAAVRAIDLEIDPLEPLLDLDAAIAPDAPLVHPEWESYATLLPGPRRDNIAWETTLERGDVEAAFARDDVIVVEDEYRAPRQHQAYIEPRNASARVEQGRIVVHSSNQFPYLIRDRVAEFLGIAPARVRVVTTTVGGGFGGKLDASLEPFAALLAQRTRRPVKIVNTRSDEFLAATPRENGIVRLRTAVTRDGELVAQEGFGLLDNGCYSAEVPAFASITMLALPSAYRFGAVRYVGRTIYTNTPPTGAYRGVSGTYHVFAAERHLDHIAEVIGMDRRELRLKNCYRAGDHHPTGQLLEDPAFEEGFAKIEELVPWREATSRGPWRGVGLAAVAWLTNPSAGSATVKLHEDGSVGIVTGATEIGTGAVTTGLVQIAAEELGVSPDDVVVLSSDTDAASFDGGAQGSRTTHSAGNAVLSAAGEARERILQIAADLMEASVADLRLEDGHVTVAGSPDQRVSLATVAQTALAAGGPVQGKGSFSAPPIPFDLACVTGAFFATMNAISYHVHLAEVEVDPDTGRVTVLRYVVAQDVGRAINPLMIEGQIDGAVAQGLGYALFENVRFDGGSPVERDLESYRLPTALDVPRIDKIIMEHPDPTGPFGAKGIAEPPILPVAAAIGNAISDAIGKPMDRLPMTPFDVLAAIRSQNGAAGHS